MNAIYIRLSARRTSGASLQSILSTITNLSPPLLERLTEHIIDRLDELADDPDFEEEPDEEDEGDFEDAGDQEPDWSTR